MTNKVANWSRFDYSQGHCASFMGKGFYCSIASLLWAKNGHLKSVWKICLIERETCNYLNSILNDGTPS